MYIRFKDGKLKTLTLSYDDGDIADIKLIDIMSKYGIKGTFNLNTGLLLDENAERIEQRGCLKPSEVRRLYTESGNEIAVHGLTHPFFNHLDNCDIIYEIAEDRKNVERDYGVLARGMAYPSGKYDDRVIGVLKSCGISYARTIKSTEEFFLPENWLALHPTCKHTNPRLMELAEKFVGLPNRGPGRMFYLWGHSWEFRDNDNWYIIENFCKYIGNRKDIWYATNIEIYDYVKAYESLVTSYDKRIIHNPTATDVWVFIDGETLVIEAGKTLYR